MSSTAPSVLRAVIGPAIRTSNAARPPPRPGKKTSTSPSGIAPLTRMSPWFAGLKPIVPEAATSPDGNVQSNCSMNSLPFSRRNFVGARCAIGNCPAEMANVVATIVPSTALGRMQSRAGPAPGALLQRDSAHAADYCPRGQDLSPPGTSSCANASPEIDARSALPRMFKSTRNGPSTRSRSRDVGGKY